MDKSVELPTALYFDRITLNQSDIAGIQRNLLYMPNTPQAVLILA